MSDSRNEFFKLRPGMLDKFEFPGTYREYTGSLNSRLKPQGEDFFFRRILLNSVREILGDKISLELLDRQLSEYPILSYADHHGLLNFKLLYNSNILFEEIARAAKLPYIIVLAVGNVPLNTQSFPRGFYFKNRKFNFFGWDESKTPVCLFEKQLNADRKIGINSFIRSFPGDALSGEEKTFLEYLFFEGLEIEKASRSFNSFSEQVTYLNFHLWKYFFDAETRESIPNIVYLESNRVLLSYYIEELKKSDSLLSLILFDPQVRRIYLREFNGIAQCWGEFAGSQFFWGVMKKKKYKKLVRLTVDDEAGLLVGEDFKLELDREIISESLKNRQIVPTLFLDYLVISFLSGYLTLGGFNQLEYLPQMQAAHVKSLKEIGMNDLAEQFASRVTDGLVCGMFPFDFDSGIDLIWHYNSTNGKFNGNLDRGLTGADLDRMNNMKVSDMIAAAVDTMLKNV